MGAAIVKFVEWVRWMAVRAFPSWGRAEVELYYQMTRKQEDFPGGFGQGPRLNSMVPTLSA